MRQLSRAELSEIISREKPGFRIASATGSVDAQRDTSRGPNADVGTPETATFRQSGHIKAHKLTTSRDSSPSQMERNSPLRDMFLGPNDYAGTESLAEAEEAESNEDSVTLDAESDDAEDAIVAVQPENDDSAPFDAAAHQAKTVVVSGKERRITSAQG